MVGATMIVCIGSDEALIIPMPMGFYRLAEKHSIDLQKIATNAIVERIRASVIADKILIAS